ncbi:hypothetical protein [Agromyces bauzanensis]
MKRLMLRALYATLITGGLTLLGAGVAHASETGGDDGILSGSQIGISIEAPITLSGNAISLIGDSWSSDATTEVVTGGGDAEPVAVTSGDDGIGSGSQSLVDVSAPVTIGGNAISVIGDSSSESADTWVASGGSGDGGSAQTSGEDSILGGTQGIVDVSAPVTIGGNAISVIGDSSSNDAVTVVESGAGSGGTDAATSGEDSILGGTQVLPSLGLPITIGGNAISVIGDSTSSGAETVVVTGTGGGSATTDGTDGLLGGTQLIPNLSLPITIGGNAISVIGDSESDGSTTIVVPTDPTDPTDPMDPTDPGDPNHPTTPGTPGGGGSGSHSTVASSPASMTAASAALASTGLDSGFWERLALVLLLTGVALVMVRKFAFRR